MSTATKWSHIIWTNQT